jgi:lipid-A-disaccharide synthase
MAVNVALRPVVGIVAGEPSGDFLGAGLIEALHARLPGARFVGIGGPRMQVAGMEVLFPMEKLAVRGYAEVLRHYLEILGIRRQLAARFLRAPPACFVGIDAPDFNLDLELQLKRAGIPTVHYVSPAVWAWRAKRIHKIKRAVSAMLVVFPFEEPIYRQAQIPVTYVGHALADELAQHPGRAAARMQLRVPLEVPVVALLPGSRVGEVEQMARPFLGAARLIAERRPNAQFLLPVVSRETRDRAEAALRELGDEPLNVTILSGHAHNAMAAADIVLAASGTATLEAALLGRPMVIAYRMPRMSWWIMKRLRRVPHVGLPNILSGERLVPELLQDEATPANLASATLALIGDPVACARLQTRFSALLQQLKQGAANKAAEALLPYVGNARA